MRKTLRVLFLVLVLSFVLTAGVACGPKFDTGAVTINPPKIASGQSSAIEVSVSNLSQSQATYKAELKVASALVEAKYVVFAPGEKKTVRFNYTGDSVGTFEVLLNSQKGSLEVVEVPEFQTTSLSVTPESVLAGESVTVNLEVKNLGEVEYAHTVVLNIDGKQGASKEVVVAAGASQTVALPITLEAGSHAVESSGLSKNIKVLKPAALKVNSLSASPPLVFTGQESTITAEVTNIGDIKGTLQVPFKVNNDAPSSQAVTLEPGASGPVSMTFSKEAAGSYDLSVGDAKTNLQVIAGKSYTARNGNFAISYPQDWTLKDDAGSSGNLVTFSKGYAALAIETDLLPMGASLQEYYRICMDQIPKSGGFTWNVLSQSEIRHDGSLFGLGAEVSLSIEGKTMRGAVLAATRGNLGFVVFGLSPESTYDINSPIFAAMLKSFTLPSSFTPPTSPPAPPPVLQKLSANLGGEPGTLDPNKASWAQERSVMAQVFDGLVGYNQDLSLKPVAAAAIPTRGNGGISADGLIYTFKLRPEVTWSDGKKVSAQDYVYSIKRMLSPEISSPYASFYFWIAGGQAYNAAGAQDPLIRSKLRDAVAVRAIDDLTLEIRLTASYPAFLQLMALWPVYPLREDVIARLGDKWTEPPNYLGNGPFILKEWVHQDHMTLTPNPNYWGTKPKIELTYRMITDNNAALAAYRNNELQIAAVPAGTEKALIADPLLGKEIVRNTELTTFGFQFNTTKAPFNDARVRQAFSYIIDRANFINTVRGGVGVPAYSWIPPGMPGYDASLGKEVTFNPSKAKQLLADAGYSDLSKLPQIKFQYSDTAGNRTIATYLQNQVNSYLGINIVLEPMASTAFNQAVNSKNYTMAWFGWGADYPDPDNWLPQLFATDGGNNRALYSSPAFDSLAKQAAVELDNARRLQLWADAQRIMINDAPILPVFYRERFFLVKPSVRGLSPTGMDGQVIGDLLFRSVYTEQAQ